MKQVAIYKITSPTGRIYIGQSYDLHNRWRQYRTKDCKSQPKLNNSLKKYGCDKHIFEIVLNCHKDISLPSLNNLENLYINLYKNSGHSMLNCRLAGNNTKPVKKSDTKIVGRIRTKSEIDKAKETSAKFIYYIEDNNDKIDTTKSVHEFANINKIYHTNLMDTLYGYDTNGNKVDRFFGFKIIKRIGKDDTIDMIKYDKILSDEITKRINKFNIKESIKCDKMTLSGKLAFKFLYKILAPSGTIDETTNLEEYCDTNNIARISLINTLYGYDSKGYKKNITHGYKLILRIPIDTLDICVKKFEELIKIETERRHKIYTERHLQYNKIKQDKIDYKNSFRNTYEILCPNGETEFVQNMFKYCKKFGLNRNSLYLTLHGLNHKGHTYTRHKKYKLIKIYPPKMYRKIDNM
jgi:GIY-YIG catalytic domain